MESTELDKMKAEVETVKGFTDYQKMAYYRVKGICQYFKLCPWKYMSLYYCSVKEGKSYSECVQRKEFFKQFGDL